MPSTRTQYTILVMGRPGNDPTGVDALVIDEVAPPSRS
jgi:hypothetical protein